MNEQLKDFNDFLLLLLLWHSTRKLQLGDSGDDYEVCLKSNGTGSINVLSKFYNMSPSK